MDIQQKTIDKQQSTIDKQQETIDSQQKEINHLQNLAEGNHIFSNDSASRHNRFLIDERLGTFI